MLAKQMVLEAASPPPPPFGEENEPPTPAVPVDTPGYFDPEEPEDPPDKAPIPPLRLKFSPTRAPPAEDALFPAPPPTVTNPEKVVSPPSLPSVPPAPPAPPAPHEYDIVLPPVVVT